MIAGRLDRWRDHLSGPVWEKAFAYIQSLGPDSPDGKTLLDGEKIFGIVMSYPTRTRQEANIESHNFYVDVQASLVNAEGIDWFPRNEITPCTEYMADKEKTYYYRPEGTASIHLDMFPGQFVVLYPHDAHQCQLIVGDEIKVVKKVVVKIHLDLLR